MNRFVFLPFIIVNIICLLSSCGVTQSTTETTSSLTPIDGRYNISTKLLEVDKLDQYYIVDQSNALRILNPNQTRGTFYQNNRLGALHSIDVSNPQKILLFYKENQQIVFVDNVLTETERINLADWGYNDVAAVAHSNDNQIWIFDSGLMKLLKVSTQGELLFEGDPLYLYYLDQAKAIKMYEAQNQVFVLTESNGFLMFDNFGQFMKPLAIEQTDDFQTDGSLITYLRRGGAFSYSLQSLAYFQEDIDLIGLEEALQVRKTKTNFILRMSDQIIVLER